MCKKIFINGKNVINNDKDKQIKLVKCNKYKS